MNQAPVRGLLSFVFLVLFLVKASGQVSAVEFGRNRIQYQKFDWKFYQTQNFNTYFSQDGLELGKYVAQIAEKELPSLEEFIEYGLQRRANLVVYNNFDELQQSNIGLGIDWQNTGGVTKLVNNKMLVYFNADRNHLRTQVRQGIARVLVQNLLFGDDLGEMATNQALLDLPQWLTDGYIAYSAETWNPALDDELKSELLSGRYTNFYQFAFRKPLLAGHAFWYYFGNKYGRSRTTYMLYLARIYRNLNSASQKIAKKKFKEVLREFMTDETQKYYKDIRGRRIAPKGQLSVAEEIRKKDFIRFNANPAPRSFTYAVVEFRSGKYTVVLNQNFTNRKVLLEYGVRARADEVNPSYPILAWDPKGTRLACVWNEKGKVKLFVYDVINRIKTVKNEELPQFDQVQDMKYMLNSNTLLFSAVKSGQTDIFVYDIAKRSTEQITNDVYDDLDASFVAFPNKTGIIFSSNRPSALAAGGDTAQIAPRYNIFLIDNWNKSEFKQVSQLSNIQLGNARFPSQYNSSHFTFVSDENGINNRYAGFFSTEAAGLDTLIFVGDEILRNPSLNEVDSLLKEWNKTDVDSVGFFATTNDSSYVFPLTNYQSGLLETRTAGDNQLVSEVTRQGDYKFLYRLRIDENALRRRNVSAKPTEYARKRAEQARVGTSGAGNIQVEEEEETSDSTKPKSTDFFQNEFEDDKKKDSSVKGQVFEGAPAVTESVLQEGKLFEYKPPKFFNDYAVAGINNTVFVPNKYQPYAGAAGPIRPANNNAINGLVRMGTADLFEDFRISGGFRIAPNLRDNDILFEATNLRKRWDYGITYYRSSSRVTLGGPGIPDLDGKQISSYYLGRLRYAFDRIRSLRLTAGPRFDNLIVVSSAPLRPTLEIPERKLAYGQISLEYVHDNTINPAMNIWHGLRYKVFSDLFTRIGGVQTGVGNRTTMFTAGFDARHYLPIYRNIIWAVRGAGDFSWGGQKVAYFLGGVDGWAIFGDNAKSRPNELGAYRYFDEDNKPDPQQNFVYQALSQNLRGFTQNIANGTNAVVLNSEVRVPVFPSFLNRPINNAFIRNFQLVQFFDLGSAWSGGISNIQRPSVQFTNAGSNQQPVAVRLKAGGIGPLAGGYGFGARSTLLGYFIRFDAAWQMNTFFGTRPKYYLAFGLDF